MVLLLGASGGLLVAALERGTEAGGRGLVFLAAYAAARIAIAFVMSDAGDREVSPAGRAHMVLGAVAFVAIAFGAADITNAIEDTPGWSDGAGSALRFASDAIGVSAVLALASYAIPQGRERAFAVAERLLYLAAIGWLAVAATHLATLAAGG
jgi:hypothetical protein